MPRANSAGISPLFIEIDVLPPPPQLIGMLSRSEKPVAPLKVSLLLSGSGSVPIIDVIVLSCGTVTL